MERVGRSWILLGALGLASGVAFVVTYWGKEAYVDSGVLKTIVCNVFAWFATLGILGFMKKWGGFENAFSKWMGRMSWGLYVFHYLFIAVTAWYLHLYAPELAPLAVYLLTGLAGFAGAYILYSIMSRIPILRWCVLGIKKEGKRV